MSAGMCMARPHSGVFLIEVSETKIRRTNISLDTLEVYERLARQGGLHHRSVRHPDLLIAAAAEARGIPVLHYDEDFDRIAAITGQPMRWIVPRGSL